MNDTLIKLVASQMGIPGAVLDELKTYRPSLISARFTRDERATNVGAPHHQQDAQVTLVVGVTSPASSFLVTVTLPDEQLKRFPAIYEQAVKLAS